jgi:hypothetical protein
MLLSLCFSQQPVQANAWVRIYTNRKLNFITYLDRTSIVRQGSRRYFWTHQTSTDGQSMGDWRNRAIASIDIYYTADCQKGALWAQYVELYDQKRQLIDTMDAQATPILQRMRNRPQNQGLVQYVCAN